MAATVLTFEFQFKLKTSYVIRNVLSKAFLIIRNTNILVIYMQIMGTSFTNERTKKFPISRYLFNLQKNESIKLKT